MTQVVDVQAVFDQVIALGYYSEDSNAYMCFALSDALEDGAITAREWCAAQRAIKAYIDGGNRGHESLAGVLFVNGYPPTFEARLAIYKDWTNRPKLNY